MRVKKLSAIGFLAFLLTLSAVIPVTADSWGDPLAIDPSGDGDYDGDDIRSVDARYANGVVYFRFQMYEYLRDDMRYTVYIDLDKNVTSGGSATNSTIGWELMFQIGIEWKGFIEAMLSMKYFGYPLSETFYNMTANNGTVISGLMDPDPWVWDIFENSSQSDLAFGVNWTLVTEWAAFYSFAGDNCSMYLEFKAHPDSD